MSEPINDGGPAFPMQGDPDDRYVGYLGMSLRDWFAGKALSGILSDNTVRDDPASFADIAYDMADAMIAARKSKQ